MKTTFPGTIFISLTEKTQRSEKYELSRACMPKSVITPLHSTISRQSDMDTGMHDRLFTQLRLVHIPQPRTRLHGLDSW